MFPCFVLCVSPAWEKWYNDLNNVRQFHDFRLLKQCSITCCCDEQPPKKPLLPDAMPDQQNRPIRTLVVELDDVLIHTQWDVRLLDLE